MELAEHYEQLAQWVENRQFSSRTTDLLNDAEGGDTHDPAAGPGNE